jgi:hypothetical protein
MSKYRAIALLLNIASFVPLALVFPGFAFGLLMGAAAPVPGAQITALIGGVTPWAALVFATIASHRLLSHNHIVVGLMVAAAPLFSAAVIYFWW